MEKIKRPSKVNLNEFAPELADTSSKFGLPQRVIFCKSCIMSNQKPNSAREYEHTPNTKKETLNIGPDGICNACRNAEMKHRDVDWDERENQLRALCDKYRKNDGSYDCLVPGSGGKDSFYTAHILKYKYGMNPLTCTWAPHIYTTWGWKNFQSWIHAGFDNFLFTPNGRVHRLLTRLATETLLHPFQPFMLGQMYLAPKLADKLNIPLIFYGENAAEYGNPFQENLSPKKDVSYFSVGDPSKVFLAGVSFQDLVSQFGLTPGDLEPYLPANVQRLKEKNTEVHYLGYYLKWHPQNSYYYAVEHGGFEACPERNPGTYSKYASLDDKIDDFNFYAMHIKFGIGRASFDASQEIRHNDITREEGVALVKRFDGEYPERFAEEIYRYLSITPKEFPVASKMFEEPIMDKTYFMSLADTFRSPHLWKHEGGQWKLRHTVWA